MKDFINKLQFITLIVFFICFVIASINLVYQLLNGIYDEISLLLWVCCLVFYMLNSYTVILIQKEKTDE